MIPRRIAMIFLSFNLVLLTALQSGCVATPKVPETKQQTGLGEVAVIATSQAPDISFEGFAHNKGVGAAKGAGATLLVCMTFMGQGTCTGFICGPAMLLWLGLCSAATVVGGAVGATVAPSGSESQAAEKTMASALDAQTIQNSLRIQVELAAQGANHFLVPISPQSMETASQQRDYRSLSAEGVDTVFEVALTKVGADDGGINPPLQLYMQAHVRLVRTSDNSELMSEDYRYTGPSMKLEEWSANNANPLLKEIENGYEVLGAHIFENTFMLYPYPDRGAHSAGFMGVSFGLKPLSPPTRGALTGDKLLGSYFEWMEVSSTRPTLRWQAFPREQDLELEPKDMARVTNVRYDLVVAEERNMMPGRVVYRRYGLTSASHALGVTLKGGTRYFWTVRARFDLDGRERLTEWSSTHYMARQGITAPSIYSYRFKTPG
ncbi:hypothetical protein [Porticoccus sp.]